MELKDSVEIKRKEIIKWPKVVIIILNWNGCKDTIESLESLKKITYPNYEVIVIDNGSEGNDADILREKYKDYIKIIKNKENLGFTGGNNIGIKYAMNNGADFIMLLNNDVVVDKRFLEPLIEIAENNFKVGIVGPTIYFYKYPYIINWVGGTISFWKGLPIRFRGNDRFEEFETLIETDYQDGCAMLVKKEVIEKVGILDEEYYLYYEDVDFCWRVRIAGYRILVARASKVWHKIASSTGGYESLACIYYSTRNRILFMKKHAKIYHWPTFLFFFGYSIAIRIGKWSIKDKKMMGVKFKALINGIHYHFH